MTISKNLRDRLSDAESVCVLTGAGISAESGVPTFRGEQGLWKKFRPEELANVDAFMRNPDLVWEWYSYRRKVVSEVQPNPGHFAIVEMQNLIRDFTLVTQNVDNLHSRAGSRGVVELHGNITRNYCIRCRRPASEELVQKSDKVPVCSHCGGFIRPDVVWFGELLPPRAYEEAEDAASRCDLFLCVGTSGVVYPAASLPQMAKEHGAFVLEINAEYTDLSPRVSETLIGKAGEILPLLVRVMKEERHHEQT